MKSNIAKLVVLASAADREGDFTTGDAVTEFLRLSQALTLNKALQGVPGMEMSTQNLGDSAEGAYREYYKGNHLGTFQDSSSSAPENPVASYAENPLNWEGKSAEEVVKMRYDEANALRNDPSMQYRNNQSLMLYAEHLRRYPNLPKYVRQQMYYTVAGMILGQLWGQPPQVMQQTLGRIYQMWPDMPADLKNYVNTEAQRTMQMQALNQQMMGANANYMGPGGQSNFNDMPTTSLLGYQGAGMTPTPF
jgi:hypothetical protein